MNSMDYKKQTNEEKEMWERIQKIVDESEESYRKLMEELLKQGN